jgi:hypothetical protein
MCVEFSKSRTTRSTLRDHVKFLSTSAAHSFSNQGDVLSTLGICIQP